jgi:hypothetical protein
MNTIKVRGQEYEVLSQTVRPFHVVKDRIVGIKPEADATLLNEFNDAWEELITQADINSMHVESRTNPDIHYLVRRINSEYYCNCACRSECWHIKMARQAWEGDDDG